MVNNITLTGRLTAKPEIRETPDGIKVTSVLIAVDRNRRNEDGTRDADFIPVTAWRGNAEFLCNNFDKGDFVAITGALRTRMRNIEGSEKAVRQMDVVAENISFCGYRRPKE